MNLPPHIHFIQRGWVSSNSIIVSGGDAPAIVDTGHHEDVAETMRLVGQCINVADLRLIVNTHCHWDHIGANNVIRAASGALTAASQATAHILVHHDRRAMWLDYFAADAAPVTVDITWQDGDMVSVGGYEFEVVATPGHAPDSIALYQPETRLLISADALHEGDCGILNTIVHGDQVLDQAIATVARLQMYDIALALPGHGGLITDVPASLNALAGRLAEFKRHPEQMAMHLLRRVAMTTVLMQQPMHRAALVAYVLARPWPHDYAPRAGFEDPEKLIHHLLDSFIHKGLVVETESQLTSLVPR